MAEIRRDSDFWHGELEAAKLRVRVAQDMVDLIDEGDRRRSLDLDRVAMGATCQMGFVLDEDTLATPILPVTRLPGDPV